MKIALIRGVAQGAGTACRCMRGTVSPYHVALLEDTRLLVWLRLCGPCSTIFERRSRSRWHEPTRSAARGAETGCAPGKNNPKSSDTSLDLIPTLRSFGPSLEGRISPGSGACTVWPSFLRVLCTCLRVPCLCFCVCQSACVGGHHVPARAWCLRGSRVRECPPFVCACLPCAATNQRPAQSQRKGAQSPRAK